MLDRATALGQAMQLTNIVRDVGEDLDRGRIYLPTSELTRFNLTTHDLVAMRRGVQPVGAGFREGIHGGIRRIGYDTLRRRAYTTLSRELLLAVGALVVLGRSRLRMADRG